MKLILENISFIHILGLFLEILDFLAGEFRVYINDKLSSSLMYKITVFTNLINLK